MTQRKKAQENQRKPEEMTKNLIPMKNVTAWCVLNRLATVEAGKSGLSAHLVMDGLIRSAQKATDIVYAIIACQSQINCGNRSTVTNRVACRTL